MSLGQQGDSVPAFLAGESEMARRIREFDWTKTPLGPVESWPRSLKTATRIMLTSRQAMWIGWGPDLTYLYNDAYKAVIGGRHPRALGLPTREVWSEIWDVIAPMLDKAFAESEGTYTEEQFLLMERNGYPEEVYYTYSYTPIPDDDGKVAGIFCPNTDDTQRVIAKRRLSLVRALAAKTRDLRAWREVCERAMEALSTELKDLPFAVLSVREPGASERSVFAGLGAGSIDERILARWPIDEVARTRHARIVKIDDESVQAVLPPGAWPKRPSAVALVPVSGAAGDQFSAVLVVGLNPFRRFDPDYSDFLSQIAGHIGAAITTAEAYAQEKQRAEGLAELDRAKTEFFSNVSHEFRTPLTLMLGPLEEMLAKPAGDVLEDNRLLASVAHRNGLRLQRLVNSLLDFSRIEAGRAQAHLEMTDISVLTRDLASTFRSAVEKAGLSLEVACPDLGEHIAVDRDMFEKIVLNLVSNAFKYTMHGSIRVATGVEGDAAIITVSDTGTGIPEAELPEIFKRFHRVKGAQARTHEGTGIGLSLVQELVKIHGGDIHVVSQVGKGSAFTVRLPRGDRATAPRTSTPEREKTSEHARRAMALEAERWLPERAGDQTAKASIGAGLKRKRAVGVGGRIVIADDNADVRQYMSKLLSDDGYAVEAVSNGRLALEAARRERPELILSDVMMPELDGFGLVDAVRKDPQLSNIAVVLVSARAGEEATIEGLDRGADDYIVKPFTAGELKARVRANVSIARLRREAATQERKLREAAETERDRLRTMWSGVRDNFCSMDKDWRFTFISEGFAKPDNLEPRDVLGKTIWELFPDVRNTTWETAARRVMQNRVAEWIEFYYPRFDMYWNLRLTPSPDGGITQLALDVTARVKAEQAAREEQARFKVLANTIPNLAWIAWPDGRIEWYNDRFYAYTGGAPGSMLGDDWKDVHDPARLQEVEAAWRNAVATGTTFDMEFPIKSAAGEFRMFLTRAVPLKDASGKITHWLGTNTDVEDQRQARAALTKNAQDLERLVLERTAELQSSHERLRMSERMASLGTLSAGLGHDMGNLLMPIRVRLELLSKSDLPDDLKKEVEAIRTSAEYLQKLATGLRMLSVDPARGRSAEVADVAAWWADAVGVMRSVLPRGVVLKSELHDASGAAAACKVRMSRTALTQAVFNLVQNAGDALKEQVSRPGASTAEVVVSCTVRGSTTRLSVRDNGPGMTPDVQTRCMEPFFTTKARGISTGLGLPLVYGLVHEAGGAVELDTAPGKGTTFTLVLPRGDLDSSGDEHPSARRTARVEVGDARLRSFIAGELRSLKYDIITGGAAAPGAGNGFDAHPDLIVSDRLKDARDVEAGTSVVLLAEGVPALESPSHGSVRVLGDKPQIGQIRDVLRELAASGETRPGTITSEKTTGGAP